LVLSRYSPFESEVHNDGSRVVSILTIKWFAESVVNPYERPGYGRNERPQTDNSSSNDEPDPRDLMRPFPPESLRMWPISTRVNQPENDEHRRLSFF
jgi:hypothetical protein